MNLTGAVIRSCCSRVNVAGMGERTSAGSAANMVYENSDLQIKTIAPVLFSSLLSSWLL